MTFLDTPLPDYISCIFIRCQLWIFDFSFKGGVVNNRSTLISVSEDIFETELKEWPWIIKLQKL